MKFIGAIGEQFVCSSLEARGWTIMQRNYRIRGGEIDFIAAKNNVILFGEVKTRRTRIQETLTLDKIDLQMHCKASPMLKGIKSYLMKFQESHDSDATDFQSMLAYCFIVGFNKEKCRCHIEAALPLTLDFYQTKRPAKKSTFS